MAVSIQKSIALSGALSIILMLLAVNIINSSFLIYGSLIKLLKNVVGKLI